MLYSMNSNSSELFLANSNSFGLCLTICSEEALLPRQTEIVSINSETGSTLRPDKVLYRAQRLLPVPVALSRHKKVSGQVYQVLALRSPAHVSAACPPGELLPQLHLQQLQLEADVVNLLPGQCCHEFFELLDYLNRSYSFIFQKPNLKNPLINM